MDLTPSGFPSPGRAGYVELTPSGFPIRATEPMPILSPREVAGLRVLEGVDYEHIAPYLDRCLLLPLDAGDTIIEAGESNATLFLVLAGSLSVRAGCGKVEIARVKAGETVGELSIIDHRAATATVIAAEPTRVLAMDEEIFWGAAQSSHGFSMNLLRLLADRMRYQSHALRERAKENEELSEQVTTDALTGVRNRRWFDEVLPELIAQSDPRFAPVSLVSLDVDHFKRVNDEHGHAVGDEVLRIMGALLRKCLRPSDYAVRTGGEEFCIVLPGTPLAGALVVAERLRRAVREFVQEGVPRVTVSLGVASLLPNDDACALAERADQALYQAKRGGRDRVETT